MAQADATSSAAFQLPSQGIEHAPKLAHQGSGFSCLGLRAVTEFAAQDNLRVQFCDGPFCVREQLDKLSSRMPRLTLGNVRGDRNGCPPHLGHQTEFLLTRKRPCNHIHALNQRHPLLPDQKILVTLRLRGVDWSFCGLVTCHSSLDFYSAATQRAIVPPLRAGFGAWRRHPRRH